MKAGEGIIIFLLFVLVVTGIFLGIKFLNKPTVPVATTNPIPGPAGQQVIQSLLQQKADLEIQIKTLQDKMDNAWVPDSQDIMDMEDLQTKLQSVLVQLAQYGQ